MTQQDIKRLQKISGYPCVSIYVPTHRAMPDRLQDPIRVKDLIGRAIDLLLKEFSKQEVEPFMAALGTLAGKIDYTQTLEGIVFFVNKDMAEMYMLPFRVPEEVAIDDNFYIRYLVRAINRNVQYWVLVLNEKPTRLLSGSGSTLVEIYDSAEARANQEGFPFEWQWEVTSDKIVQAAREGCKNGSYKTDKRLEFFQQVDKALDAHVNSDKWPIIVLGLEEHWGEFKQVTKHAARIVAYETGGYARASIDDLAKAIEPIVQAYMTEEKTAALKMFFETLGTQKHASGISEVWQRAYEGRVRILLIEEGFSISGFKNSAKPDEIIVCEDKEAPGISEDIADDLIELVLAKDGKVVFVPAGSLKDHGCVGAILRY